jgi:glycosyltransferase involved in cell wall biosynthesis
VLVTMRVAIIGPLPPPSGGMATQTRQLREMLDGAGVAVEIVQTNRPYRPAIVGRMRGLRAALRFVPYAFSLWRAAERSTVFHVMANSGWAWHLFAAPAIWIAKARGVRVVVNYRGGAASTFLARSVRVVRPTMRLADVIAVPSGFLQDVFSHFGIDARLIPNVVDTRRFFPMHAPRMSCMGPHIVVARNLEPIYDIQTALRAFALLHRKRPEAKLSIAGSGPERRRLERLVDELGLSHTVVFRGALSHDAMAELYRSATIVLNASLVDNTPNSLLEAMACGVPIVSTNVGGIPFLVQHAVTAMLVPAQDPDALADAMCTVLDDPLLAARLVENGLHVARRCEWSNVYPLWIRAYQEEQGQRELLTDGHPPRRTKHEHTHDEVRG